MSFLVDALIEWPRRVARHLTWLGPLFARIVTGWVFTGTGWGKLNHLPMVVENFTNWGIPAPQLLGPFVSGVEFFGGIFLVAGLLTRISAGALGVVMIVAVKAAQWDGVEDSELGRRLGVANLRFDEWFHPFRDQIPVHPYSSA